MGKRLRRHGRDVRVVEFRCPNCKRGLLCSQGEATPPKPGQVPYCGHCLKLGLLVQMRRREYPNGPIDLHV